MEKVVTENSEYSSQLVDAKHRVAELDSELQNKITQVSTYQDMLEQSQGQFIVLEKKYTKAKKIIKGEKLMLTYCIQTELSIIKLVRDEDYYTVQVFREVKAKYTWFSICARVVFSKSLAQMEFA